MGYSSFWENAAAHPDRPAIISAAGEVVTFGELASQANRLANGLRERGLGVGDTVALMAANRAEYFAVQLATGQIGLVLALINRHLTAPEAAYILSDSHARLLIADSRTGDAAVGAAELAGLGVDARFAIGDVAGFADWRELWAADEPPTNRTAGSLLLYSSGTTGAPKGISKPLSELAPEQEDQLVVESLAAFDVARDGVFLSVAPLYHSAPNRHASSALARGMSVVLADRSDPAHLLELIDAHHVVETFLVPTMMHRMLALDEAERGRYDTSSLRTVLHAGAMCPPPVKAAMIEWLGPKLMEYYGATESGAITMISSADWLAHPGSVGRARPGTDVQIRDEAGNLVSPGVVGLIHLLTGRPFEYHGDRAKTDASHRDGYFVPGDLGSLDEDGYLYLSDRRTDLIVSGGVNIYPAEIESVLLDQPGVTDAVVFGVPDDEWGQRVVALVSSDSADVSPISLREAAERELADYKIPRTIEIVSSLPRTPSGKLSRAKVRAAYADNGAESVAAL
ncbi:AMP-binding protein [Epidermidibacterium keratini]|uniref:AMP-binding protein n=1 Tax=Epidermidibacterium keratini TaxID=1891644 RepID=A0A7L4YLI4_9ACTN|nr:AMP-binding protein [Epidermidibacterium keratini]QHC00131.1 AMP-binding protein [Epidermidibacterium keratini]